MYHENAGLFKLLLIGLNKKALSIEIFNGNFFNTENKT